MAQDLPLLINITVALVTAFLGGIIARRIGLPTIVGYLLAGIVIGPFTPGFVGDTHTIHQLAELGVIFLMFGVGLHFSLKQLWRVRDIAIPGALIQTTLATLAGVGLSSLWGWSLSAGLVLGLSISVASTVVLMRGLIDNKLMQTEHGQSAVGWLVMEDILSVLILVIMPVLQASEGSFNWSSMGITLLKAAAFLVVMFFIGKKLIPWLLEYVAHTHSRELFILVVLVITLGTAMGAAGFFGISLALGAFLSGAIISQTLLSHQVGADVFSFREAFSVLFFVSVGMLVNPVFLWQNIGQVTTLSLMVIFGKILIVLLISLLFKKPLRTFIVVAMGLSQVGEFTFILGQSGLQLNLLTTDQYSLLLAASLISITVNPFMYKLIDPLEKFFARIPIFRSKTPLETPQDKPYQTTLKDHVVIVGYDRIGRHLVDVLDSLKIPLLVVDEYVERIIELHDRNIPTLFGDASNSEVLNETHLEDARLLVITTLDDSATSIIVIKARDLAPDLTIMASSSSQDGLVHLERLGANYIVLPELEGGLELIHHTLLELNFPLHQVHAYTQAVRRDHYDLEEISNEEHESLDALLVAYKGIDICWMRVEEGSMLIDISLAEANIRMMTGASVVALIRDGQLHPNPKSQTVFQTGDKLGLIGDERQIDAVRHMILPISQPLENTSA